MPKVAYYAGMIWVGLIAIQLFMFGLNEFMGIWPGFGWLCGAHISCRTFLDAWTGSLLLLLLPVVPGAILWWWGKTQMKRSAQNA